MLCFAFACGGVGRLLAVARRERFETAAPTYPYTDHTKTPRQHHTTMIPQVINFDLCDPQRYMQRIGRVGRFGRAGTAISLIPPYQVSTKQRTTYDAFLGHSVPSVEWIQGPQNRRPRPLTNSQPLSLPFLSRPSDLTPIDGSPFKTTKTSKRWTSPRGATTPSSTSRRRTTTPSTAGTSSRSEFSWLRSNQDERADCPNCGSPRDTPTPSTTAQQPTYVSLPPCLQQGDFPPRDAFVQQLPGFGIEQALLDAVAEADKEVDGLAQGVAGVSVGN